MPMGKYVSGKGAEVMDSMQKTYQDPKKAKQVFYATANKNGQKPKSMNEGKPAKRKSIGQMIAEG